MRLGEAMQMGCIALNPTVGTGRWIVWDENWEPCGGCILGVTAVAAGYRFRWGGDTLTFLMDTFPLLHRVTPFPDKRSWPLSLQAQIHLLFEHHGWPWPKIVEWVQSVEEQVEAEHKDQQQIEQRDQCQSTK